MREGGVRLTADGGPVFKIDVPFQVCAVGEEASQGVRGIGAQVTHSIRHQNQGNAGVEGMGQSRLP